MNLDIEVLEQYTAHLACTFVCEENWNPLEPNNYLPTYPTQSSLYREKQWAMTIATSQAFLVSNCDWGQGKGISTALYLATPPHLIDSNLVCILCVDREESKLPQESEFGEGVFLSSSTRGPTVHSHVVLVRFPSVFLFYAHLFATLV